MDPSGFVDLLAGYFRGNLRAILQYGSSTTSTHPADVDILVVLNQKRDSSHDLQLMRKAARHFPETYFDLQLVYVEEITDTENFSLDSHGCFFALVLRNARVLWGENPFSAITPERKEVMRSVVRKL